MKKILILQTILFLTVTVYGQSDTLLYNYKQARDITEKLLIKRLSLADIVVNENSIPSGVREFENLKFLSLRPIPVSFGRPSGGGLCIIRYAKTKTTTLPLWINELDSLEEVDLIGITNIDYSVELQKLIGLKNLRTLSIDPDEFSSSLIDVLTKFSELKSLKVRATVTDSQLTELKKGLMDCEIVTGIYANY
jgi:hypothetical protein